MNLDLKNHQLKTIEKNHRGDDERCRTEMLICWLDNTTTPTWEAVAEALDRMEQDRIADEIRKKYVNSTITIEGAILHKPLMSVIYDPYAILYLYQP